MKVHLIRTPEYSNQDLHEVTDFLSSFAGPVQFLASEFSFDPYQFTFLQINKIDRMCSMMEPVPKKNPEDYKEDKYQHNILEWGQLLELCRHYRTSEYVPSEDFVFLLTERSNEWNWFSFIDENRNAFVQVEGWMNFINVEHKYPTAYQIAENILQSLMEIDVINIPNKYVHQIARGCVNDFCENKQDVTLKLRTADICPDCFERIEEKKIDKNIIHQMLEIFEGIRKELLFKQKFKKLVKPVQIKLNEKNKIVLPDLNNQEIRLNPLFKTLYLFFLKHQEGIRLKDMIYYKAELMSLYKKLSVIDESVAEMDAKIADMVNPHSGSFSQKKAKINKIIRDLLGEPLAGFYGIDGQPGEAFKINIPQNLIDIRY